jgi:hypothetical protein
MLGYLPEFDRGIKRARFAVLRLSKIPAILVEGGFVSERQQARLIANREWRGRLAQSISVGIENYRRLVETKQRPMLLADYRRQFDGGTLVARDATAPAAESPEAAVMPASNQQAAGNYQASASLRREPSELIDVEPAAAPDAPPSGSPPPDVAAALEKAAPPPDAPAPGAAEPDAGSLPPAPETSDTVAAASVEQPADMQAEPPRPITVAAEAAPQLAPGPASSPENQKTRKYWILNFDPPPKFRP